MPAVLSNNTRPARAYLAIALFIVVYLGVLAVVFAPKDMIAAQSPNALIAGN